jgi:hypothetical protein
MTFHTILLVMIHPLLNEGDTTAKPTCPDADREFSTGKFQINCDILLVYIKFISIFIYHRKGKNITFKTINFNSVI